MLSDDQIKVELCSSWGSDRTAAEAAWASSASKEKLESRTEDDVRRVVSSLVHLHHQTPKERQWMEFFITLPIFCERQFDKYRMTVQYQDIRVDFLLAPFGRDGITQNELSGRYRTIPDRPLELPDDVSSILAAAVTHWSPTREIYTPGEMKEDFESILKAQHTQYQEYLTALKAAVDGQAISKGDYKRAREVLRGILGTAFLTDMRIVMNMNAFEHIVTQRLARDSQRESRIVAAKMVTEMRKHEVCPHMLEEMAVANDWDMHIQELECV